MPALQLIQEIVRRSVADDWERARREWELWNVYEADDPETCLCGHFPIIELCELLNRLNRKQVVVGNCCVKRFLGLPSDQIFKAIKRIRKDSASSLNTEAIHHALHRGWINEWEAKFYLDVMKKRSLTDKQWAKKRQINELVLLKMKRQ
jgi:hypothetical protein